MGKPDDKLLQVLKEREKELNCLYRIEEVLNNRQLSLPEIFQEIIAIIPSGWQYSELCQARIIYENFSYQSSDFHPTPWMLSSEIKVNEKAHGQLEVSYKKKVPWQEDGYFLKKEEQLIRSIAHRVGQMILHRRVEYALREWEQAKAGTGVSKEWVIILDLLRRTDEHMLEQICEKMINYLSWQGTEQSGDLLAKIRELSPAEPEENPIDVNVPRAKRPVDLTGSCDRIFQLAGEHLSDDEITIHLKKWILEEKGSRLIKVLNRIDVSLPEIIEAISEFSKITTGTEEIYSPTDRWLKVALIRRFLSTDLDYINVAKQFVRISEVHEESKRVIFPGRSQGKLGGKSAGLLLAKWILEKQGDEVQTFFPIKVPKTWFITTDGITEFLSYNNLEELNEFKYKGLAENRMSYPHIVQRMKNSRFPVELVKSLAMALDDFGDKPLIVRSSSKLEDQVGASFSGKYKSLFLSNRGSKQKRLEELMDAIAEVYASLYNPDSIQYRAERGLLDFHEEMGIMIQELVGQQIGPYYLPLAAGVIFSNNELRWSPRVKRQDGLVRIVPGFGTRAVDRLSDDFPILVSPGQPALRVNHTPEEAKYYSPKKLDLINLEKETFETVDAGDFLRSYGDEISHLHTLVSIYQEDHLVLPSRFEIDPTRDDLVITFEGLFSRTPFLKQVASILKTLGEKMGRPVDLEFAFDGENFYLLQCRAQSSTQGNQASPIPKDIPAKDIIFTANRYVSNGIISSASYVVYVDPEEYGRLSELEDLIRVGHAIGKLNTILPKRQFILMGPGRWGSRGDIKLGVQVSYGDLNNTSLLIEIARQKGKYLPELSFGTHFFQDLVEADIRYLPLYPDTHGIIFNEAFFRKNTNLLEKLLPEFADLGEVIRVIDVSAATFGKTLRVLMNGELGEALGYVDAPDRVLAEPEQAGEVALPKPDDDFWRWRFHMAERIASELDPEYFGVKGIYIFGSVNNGTAGPGSDIDLLIHFQGNERQRQELTKWLEGWSSCLAEMNYLKTGYASQGILDLHFVTDRDIAERTVFAAKIDAHTDPARSLKMKKK